MTNTQFPRWHFVSLLLAWAFATGAFAQGAETLILFDPTAPPETPESIVFDRQDNAYITLSTTGEIRKSRPI